MGVRFIKTIESSDPGDWVNSREHGAGLDVHIRKSASSALNMANAIANSMSPAEAEVTSESKTLKYINNLIDEVLRGNML